jgi:CHAD domain-containing protein
MRSGIDQLTTNHTAGLNGRNIECVHQMRVALRRLSATLALFRDVISSPSAARITDDLRWLGSILGRARDWDVFATQTVEKVNKAPRALVAAESSAEAASALRLAAHREAAQALGSARYYALIRAMDTWLAGKQWCESLDPAIRPLLEAPLAEAGRPWLDRSARKARKAGKGIKHLTGKQRHRLRITIKQLRYDTQSLSSLYADKKVRPYVDALRDLQDVLGDLNDLAVARKLMGIVKGRDFAAMNDRLGAAIAERLKALAPAWRHFRKISPFWE